MTFNHDTRSHFIITMWPEEVFVESGRLTVPRWEEEDWILSLGGHFPAVWPLGASSCRMWWSVTTARVEPPSDPSWPPASASLWWTSEVRSSPCTPSERCAAPPASCRAPPSSRYPPSVKQTRLEIMSPALPSGERIPKFYSEIDNDNSHLCCFYSKQTLKHL